MKVQIIGILEEIGAEAPLLTKNAPLEKATKFLAGPSPPPLIWTKSKRRATFFRESFPYSYLVFSIFPKDLAPFHQFSVQYLLKLLTFKCKRSIKSTTPTPTPPPRKERFLAPQL